MGIMSLRCRRKTSVVLSGRVTHHRGMASCSSSCPAAFYASVYTINKRHLDCKPFYVIQEKESPGRSQAPSRAWSDRPPPPLRCPSRARGPHGCAGCYLRGKDRPFRARGPRAGTRALPLFRARGPRAGTRALHPFPERKATSSSGPSHGLRPGAAPRGETHPLRLSPAARSGSRKGTPPAAGSPRR